MVQEIYIIDDKPNLRETLKRLFEEDKSYRFKSVPTEELDVALKNIPSLIIINEDNIDEDIISICEKIKKDDDNTITPVIVLSSNKDHDHRINLLKLGVSHYIINPINEDFFYYTIQNTLYLIYINRRVSPLTGLPGNVQIQAEMKKRFSLKETFAMIYIDLDNFKAYNDVYGFLKGDEIIEFTAQTILKCTHRIFPDNSFIGDIGGDDFIAVIPSIDVDDICQEIIASFDKNVGKFFTEEDLEQGYIEVANRKGIIEQFPLTSISIGVVIAEKDRFSNILEIGEVGAQVKHMAKSIVGSSYAIDRRQQI